MNLVVGDPRAWTLLALLPVMATLWARSKIYMTRRARLALLALRMAAVLLLILALADLRLPRTARGTGRAVAVVLDASDSVGRETAEDLVAQAGELFPQWRAAAGPGADLRVAVLGAELVPLPAAATAGRALAEGALAEAVEKARAGEGKRSTDLGAALRWTREAFPGAADVRLVLASDGEETRGDLEGETLAAKLDGLQVYPVEVGPQQEDPLWVAALHAPTQVFVGDEYTVAGRVHSAQAGSVRLTLRQNDTIVHQQTLAVVAGETPFRHKLKAAATGAVGLELSVDPIDVPDLHPENNAFSAFTRVRQVPRILLASAEPEKQLALKKALEKANLEFQVSRFVDLGSSDALLARHSAIILDSPAGNDLTQSQQDALRKYVERKGGGLIFIGGKNTLARGTSLREGLGEVLPVDLVPRAEASPFGLYLLLDSSSSMAGAPIAQVKFAARRIISMMAGRWLGVAAFNTGVYEVVPFQPVGGSGYRASMDIDQIRAVGGTAFVPGLDLAMTELVKGGTTDNHILLLSDGQPSDRFVVKRLFPKLRGAGIRVSTVGIGAQVNTGLLQEIARECDGRFYGVSDLSKLVEIFEQEVERLIGPPYEEVEFVPTVRGDHFLTGELAGKRMPALHGYLGTTLKKGAEAPIVNGYQDPILAYWQKGLGKAIVWASDVHGPWGKDWRAWQDGFLPFWEGVIKAVVRSEVSDHKLALQLDGKHGEIVVDAVSKDGRYLNGERLEAVVRPPGGAAVERVRLRQTEEGRYEGRFTATQRGFYAVQLMRQVGGLDERVNEGGVALGFDPEYFPEDAGGGAALTRLANATGGRRLRDLVDVTFVLAEEVRKQQREELEFWPYLLAMALLVFFAEVALRRLGKFHVSKISDLEGGAEEGAAAYHAIAERYVQMAEDHDSRGDHQQAQRYYLKARSFFLKSNSEDKASRMWEKYRQAERR